MVPGDPTTPIQTTGDKQQAGGLQSLSPLSGEDTLSQELESPPPYPWQQLCPSLRNFTLPIGAEKGVEENRGSTLAPSQGVESRDYTPPEGAGGRCGTDWQKIKEVAEEKGLVTAFPVVIGEEGLEWAPLDPKEVTRLIEAVEKKALRPPLTLNALEALTESGPMLPYDTENLMHMVLKPVQYTIWKEEWLTELKQVVAAAQDNPGHPVHGTNMLRLTGSAAGMSTSRVHLAQLHPGELLATTDAAIGAFRNFARSTEPSTHWLGIAQGPIESFQEFADRLMKAVEGSDLPRAVHGPVIVDCLKQRSLEDIKTLLRAAPGKISTPGEVIRYVLDKQKSTPLTNEGLAAAITNVMAVTSRPLRAAESSRGPCCRCGRFGHTKAQCTVPMDNEKGGPCVRCGQFGHIKVQC